jgi:hypothetical protein
LKAVLDLLSRDPLPARDFELESLPASAPGGAPPVRRAARRKA